MNKEKTILVVEDEVEIQDLLKMRLRVEGFRVLIAHDGKEGLEILRKEKPDMVLLDLMMPGLSGFEVCKIMKDDALLKHIPIIVLTAKVDKGARNYSLELGADAYVAKPYEWKMLSETIKSLLQANEKE